MLVLHYTGMRSGGEALDRLCDPAARVSSHYVVEEDGAIWRLVPEARRAWHAGVSHWRGQTGLNDRSIGIEIVNPGHEWGYRAFPALQMAALCDLCLEVLAGNPIPQRNVVAHSDIAPDRKQDPGELFDWEGLAANGVGVWPTAVMAAREEGQPLGLLAAIGYRADLSLDVLLTAFQRHWRPAKVDGVADPETLARLRSVAAVMAGEG
jgi:N-acetylmuramoyl-L-alanine amidase